MRDDDSKSERERRGTRRRLEDLQSDGEFSDSIPDENASSAANAFEGRELSAELRSLLSGLVAADQLLLRLRFDDGLSAQEVAGILRYPSQFHVYRRINVLLAELRAALESRGFDSAAS